ncbi:phage replisome organizer N-terminal domain-containing protein [Listeria booriae]|uniref:phage replisome organizer N-terminal domain-containing protein n=1 Tax=Listeria booriae TaxID=1552123 RepID=UPI00162A457D|nr:phage replisome organizer N-terminal domain-containing protein [Listeria booriae]MBC2190508.1 hypothetical protein [Listeria booriae]
MAKKYYWLKLKNDFFRNPEVKILRRVAGGDTYTLIYLEMMLLSLENEGHLYFEGFGDDMADELSVILDEQKEDVQFLMTFLQAKNLIEVKEGDQYFMNTIPEMIGKETESARKMRVHRAKEQQKKLPDPPKRSHCDSDVTESDTEIEIDKEIDKEKDIPREKICEVHLQLANHLFNKMLENNPEAKKPNLNSWANTFRLTMERDKRTAEQIIYLIDWSQQNHFWHKNILSANAIRKQFDRLVLEIKDERSNAKSNYKKGSGRQEVLPDWFDKDKAVVSAPTEDVKPQNPDLAARVEEMKKRLKEGK